MTSMFRFAINICIHVYVCVDIRSCRDVLLESAVHLQYVPIPRFDTIDGTISLIYAQGIVM